MTEPLLEIRDLHVEFHREGRRKGPPVRAVDGVSLQLASGETLGLVGESGSGKSTIGNAVLGLVRATSGEILFHGKDITHASQAERRELSSKIQVVFQDPYSSLNPSRTIGQTLAEPLRMKRGISASEVTQRIEDMLLQVGMSPDTVHRFPREFSGGQRQRIAIARALVREPVVVICDEPTSALDLSVQAQILNLLLDLQDRFQMSYLFISHDIDVVRHMAHHAAVLHRGRIVEAGPVQQVTVHPIHPYTQRLLTASPIPDPREQARRRQERAVAATTAASGVEPPANSATPPMSALSAASTDTPVRSTR